MRLSMHSLAGACVWVCVRQGNSAVFEVLNLLRVVWFVGELLLDLGEDDRFLMGYGKTSLNQSLLM